MGMHTHAGGLDRQISALFLGNGFITIQGQSGRKVPSHKPVDVLSQLLGPVQIAVHDVNGCCSLFGQHIGGCLGRASCAYQDTPLPAHMDPGPQKGGIRIISLIAMFRPHQCVDRTNGFGVPIYVCQEFHDPLFMGHGHVHSQDIQGKGTFYRVPHLLIFHFKGHIGQVHPCPPGIKVMHQR